MDHDDTLFRDLGASLARLAAGDQSARTRIMEVCQERMQMLSRRMLRGFPNVGRWQDEDDVRQEANLRLLTALEKMTFATPRDFMAIAVTQIKRVLIDMARHYAGPMSDAANHASVAGELNDAVLHAAARQSHLENWTAFHEAVERLPPHLREVFHLVWYMGADQQTVSELIGKSKRTVKRYWQEARDIVRAALGDAAPESTTNG